MKYLFLLLGFIAGGLTVKQMYNETPSAVEILIISAIYLFIALRRVLIESDEED